MYIILHACVQGEEAWCLQEADTGSILVGRMVLLLWSVSLAASLLILAQIFLGETRVPEKVVEVVAENPIQPWVEKSRNSKHGNGQQPHFHRILDTCSKKWAKRVRKKWITVLRLQSEIAHCYLIKNPWTRQTRSHVYSRPTCKA